MPVLRYVPPKKNIIDRRSDEGGYYVASCECCGTEFYPTRSNARFCSSNCTLINHREKKLSGTKDNLANPTKIIPKNIEVKPTSHNQWEEIFVGKQSIFIFLENAEMRTHGVKRKVTALKIGETLDWEGYKIGRVSDKKFGIFKHN